MDRRRVELRPSGCKPEVLPLSLSAHWKLVILFTSIIRNWWTWQDSNLQLPLYERGFLPLNYRSSKLGRICFSEVTCILPNRRPTKGFYFSRSASTCWMAIHAVGYAAPWVRCSPQLSLTRSQDFNHARQCMRLHCACRLWYPTIDFNQHVGIRTTVSPIARGILPFLNYSCLVFMWQTPINGGPVLQWRGPFFFLPTNPLRCRLSLLGRPPHRHRGTQLATTSNCPCQP